MKAAAIIESDTEVEGFEARFAANEVIIAKAPLSTGYFIFRKGVKMRKENLEILFGLKTRAHCSVME